ncbi:MAG: hypothetical protein COV67_00405 [Nitrospinae bacterium CG11_big_fil_rev_8_21_14_0_20_56_8]|nr:MAG: hypothetical protein COV67_00405 [Nitrospinae bacterium CG11_big_fil_rev_8_21_14_0_20_56_8]
MSQAIYLPGTFTDAQRETLKKKSVLFLLSSRGHPVQELLLPMRHLLNSGIRVDLATLDGGPVRLDFLCNILAVLECACNQAFQCLRDEARARRLSHTVSLRALQRENRLGSYLDSFDALVVPGGHGRVYREFVFSELTGEVVRHFSTRRKVVGLQCHSVVLAGQVDTGGMKEVTCWPRCYERILSSIPFLKPLFKPFGVFAQDLVEAKNMKVLYHPCNPNNPRAVIDRHLVTCWGPWSMPQFSYAVQHLLCADAS